jgi:cytochrome b pre-mRNA-processing protein 3
MFAWLKSKVERRRNARELYGSSVTQAREPAFYDALGVPDTVQGRFEMILLHVSLLLARLQREGKPGADLARALSESFIVDMDDGMREMTFGDLAVPREIKRAAAALFDRHTAYRAAIGASDVALLMRTLDEELAYLPHAGRLDVAGLAHYMTVATGALDGQTAAALFAGRVAWPAPQARSAASP